MSGIGRPPVDLTGHRSHRLIVTHQSSEWRSRGKTMWACQCDCGGQIIARADVLRKQRLKSCGCLRREHSKAMLAAFLAPQIEEFEGICETLASVATRFPMSCRELFALVRGVWGHIDSRRLFRALATVIERGLIERVGKRWSSSAGYVRLVPWAQNLASCISEAAAAWAVLDLGRRRAA